MRLKENATNCKFKVFKASDIKYKKISKNARSFTLWRGKMFLKRGNLYDIDIANNKIITAGKAY